MHTTTASPILDAYLRRTPGSARLAEEARDVFPSGVTHDSRFLEPFAIYVDRAAGSRKWDVDGNEYVDYCGGHGALLLGHNHPHVTQAIRKALECGTHFGACHELEVRWGKAVQRLIPTAERVRFTSSGTEATLLALRLARAHTDRKKVLRFLGHFHGWHDHMAFAVSSHFDGRPTPGVLPEIAENIVLAPANDIEATRALLDQHRPAAAIIEPTGASWGQVPVAREFLTALRELTAERGVTLIFDEVISGFRVAPGGAQQAFGIEPDLTTLAKILAGGLPGGAIVGRAEIMDHLAFPTADGPRRDKIPHQGTFNANPLCAAAGVATLEIVAETDACERANHYAERLRERLREVLARERVGWLVYGTYSGFHIFFNPRRLPVTAAEIESGKLDHTAIKERPRPSLATKLRLGMSIHGVEIFSWPGGPTSAVHTDADLDRTIDAFRQTLKMLRAEGEID